MLVPVLTLPVLAGLAYAFGLRFMGALDRRGPQSLADTLADTEMEMVLLQRKYLS